MKEGLGYAALTAVVSTASNVPRFMAGEITADEMALEVASKSGVAFGTGVGISVANKAMVQSGNRLLGKCAGANVASAMVSFGIETHEDIYNYMTGKIDEIELAYNLGEGAASVGGGMAGMKAGAVAGGAIGTAIAPGVGTAVGGAAGSLVGGVVGSIIVTEAYKVGVSTGAQGVEFLRENANTMANDTIEFAKETIPDKANVIRDAFVDYANEMKLKMEFIQL